MEGVVITFRLSLLHQDTLVEIQWVERTNFNLEESIPIGTQICPLTKFFFIPASLDIYPLYLYSGISTNADISTSPVVVQITSHSRQILIMNSPLPNLNNTHWPQLHLILVMRKPRGIHPPLFIASAINNTAN